MLKKEIAFEDFDGNPQRKIYYFNLTKTELIKMEITGTGGSMGEFVKRIIDAKDNRELVEVFDKIILGAVGRRSDDGERFDKSPEIAENFKCSAAYDALFIEFVTNSGAAADFINALIPKGIEEVAAKILAANPVTVSMDVDDPAFQALQLKANESRAQGFNPPPPPAVHSTPSV